MNIAKKFEIRNGEFLMDGLPQTKEFVQGNTEYITGFILQFQQILGKGGPVTAVCQEDDWAFSINVEEAEFGRIANGKGAYIEGANLVLNELIQDLGGSSAQPL